jgi:hypothetical protein
MDGWLLNTLNTSPTRLALTTFFLIFPPIGEIRVLIVVNAAFGGDVLSSLAWNLNPVSWPNSSA